MTNEEMLSVAEIVERLVARFHKQADDHEAKMVEHRAAFGARTKADAETIDRLHTERDALRAEVAELKTQLERLTSWAAKNQAARETLQTEIERLKSQTPKHPVKVGEHVAWCGSGFLTGTIKQVAEVRSDRAYRFTDDDVWSFALCEPCDPPATHDTEAGKAVAESAAKTEPVADEIKAGDLVEVYQATAVCTRQDDIGSRGIVEFADECVSLTPVDGFKAAQENHVGLCDVRKVTT